MKAKKLNLKKVDLIAIDGSKKTERLNVLLKIAEYSLSVADFNSVKIFTGCETITNHPVIKLLRANVNSLAEYNKFILKDLASHVDGTHCLIFQHDGFIINPSMWTDDFLNCDYIGAPWPKKHKEDEKRPNMVGNGGFSLRTKKIIKACEHIETDFKTNEDWLICVNKYKQLKEAGIKFADRELAAKFSLELDNEINSDITKVFGFHGNVNMKDIGPRSKKMKEIVKNYPTDKRAISEIYQFAENNPQYLLT